MNSCLYECRVMHHRFTPKEHGFVYRLFLFAIDLDELEELSRRLRLFSVDRANLFSLRQSDYLPTREPLHNASRPTSVAAAGARSLKERVLAFLAARGVDLTGGRVVLVTLPRVAGYLFNPVSFYFCYDRDGVPAAALAEVTNTFREMKPFHVSESVGGGTFRLRTPKDFYVSPFSDVDVEFDFTLRSPDERLAVQIDDYVAGVRTLTSSVHGTRLVLTDARLAWFTLKHPLVTLRIIFLIHLQALRLWLKRVPWFPKAARADAQRDLYRPHASLLNAKP